LLLSAVPLSVDISCQRGAQQQTRHSGVWLSTNDETDGRTDGQTDRRALDHRIDLAPHTMRAASKIA